jgi:hypothetical protein
MKGIEGTASFNWRRSADPALFGLLREHILDGPPALFDIVRRPQAEKVLAEPSFNSATFIWQAFTASVLLGGDFLAAPPRLPTVTVSIR